MKKPDFKSLPIMQRRCHMCGFDGRCVYSLPNCAWICQPCILALAQRLDDDGGGDQEEPTSAAGQAGESPASPPAAATHKRKGKHL